MIQHVLSASRRLALAAVCTVAVATTAHAQYCAGTAPNDQFFDIGIRRDRLKPGVGHVHRAQIDAAVVRVTEVGDGHASAKETARDNQVLATPDDMHVTVGVDAGEVAGDEETVFA